MKCWHPLIHCNKAIRLFRKWLIYNQHRCQVDTANGQILIQIQIKTSIHILSNCKNKSKTKMAKTIKCLLLSNSKDKLYQVSNIILFTKLMVAIKLLHKFWKSFQTRTTKLRLKYWVLANTQKATGDNKIFNLQQQLHCLLLYYILLFELFKFFLT